MIEISHLSGFRPEKSKEIPAPTQGNSSVSEYIKMIKLYAIAIGKDLPEALKVDDIDVKVKFLSGLSPDNHEKRVYEFGVKKPLTEIFEYLDKASTQPLIQGGNNFISELLNQKPELDLPI